MNQEIPYLDELMGLVEHQRQRDYLVRYKFLIVSGDDVDRLLVYALKKEGSDYETAMPLFSHPNREPLILWSKDGYIGIVEGGIAKGTGGFRLTPSAKGLKRA